MKKNIFTLLSLCALLCSSPTLFSSPRDGGGIVFIGDSITQGGSYLAGKVPSYRYQLFKNFTDNGIAFVPMGMTDGARGGVDVSALMPDYRGAKFTNVSEAAASGRAYQYSGHPESRGGEWGKDQFKADPGSVANAQNRGPVTLKLEQENPYTKSDKTFYDGAKLLTYSGETYRSRYGSKKPETLCVMIGINDIYDSGSPETVRATAGWVEEIVRAYQRANPSIEVHIFKLLPTGKNNGTGAKNGYRYKVYNDYLESLDIPATWSKGKSKVFLDDISAGFYAKNGAMCDTTGGAHPNAQGELIVAGNIARALGIGQRDCGFAEVRKASEKLDMQIDFEDRRVVAKRRDGSARNFSQIGEETRFRTKAGTLQIAERSEKGSGVWELKWFPSVASRAVRECTAVFKVKMRSADGGKVPTELTKNNRFSIFFGNGKDQVGILGIGENGIFWNGNKLLYGSGMDLYGNETLADLTAKESLAFDPMAGYFTRKAHEFRVIYKQDEGYFIWLDDQLIGEKLSGNADAGLVEKHKDKLLFGDTSGANACCAEVLSAAFSVR